jgi:pilus assembly protein Flp/PilA
MVALIQNLWNDESGATMVEYALMVALIAVVAIVAVGALGDGVVATFEAAEDAITP